MSNGLWASSLTLRGYSQILSHAERPAPLWCAHWLAAVQRHNSRLARRARGGSRLLGARRSRLIATVARLKFEEFLGDLQSLPSIIARCVAEPWETGWSGRTCEPSEIRDTGRCRARAHVVPH